MKELNFLNAEDVDFMTAVNYSVKQLDSYLKNQTIDEKKDIANLLKSELEKQLEIEENKSDDLKKGSVTEAFLRAALGFSNSYEKNFDDVFYDNLYPVAKETCHPKITNSLIHQIFSKDKMFVNYVNPPIKF